MWCQAPSAHPVPEPRHNTTGLSGVLRYVYILFRWVMAAGYMRVHVEPCCNPELSQGIPASPKTSRGLGSLTTSLCIRARLNIGKLKGLDSPRAQLLQPFALLAVWLICCPMVQCPPGMAPNGQLLLILALRLRRVSQISIKFSCSPKKLAKFLCST